MNFLKKVYHAGKGLVMKAAQVASDAKALIVTTFGAATGYATLGMQRAHAALSEDVTTAFATAETDIGTVQDLVIGIVLLIVMFFVVVRVIKRT